MKFLFLIFALLMLSHVSASAAKWEFATGEEISGEPVAFDFQKKLIQWEDPLTDTTQIVPARNLSLRSKQRLVMGSLIHDNFEGESMWPHERRVMLLKVLGVPAIIMLSAFWIVGILVTRKWNPVRAIIGFSGGWIVAAIFVVMYIFFSNRLGGGMKTILTGIGAAGIFSAMFTSVVYNASFIKGLALFVLHIIASLGLLMTTIIVFELATTETQAEEFWTEHIFVPSGLQAP